MLPFNKSLSVVGRVIFCVLWSLPCLAHQSYSENLELEGVFSIENSVGLEPSGLASCGGELLFVSDSDDRTIYRLREEGGTLRAEEFYSVAGFPQKDLTVYPDERRILIEWAQANLDNYLDWEGLTCRGGNKLYLMSETFADILSISVRRGELKNIQWLETPLYTIGSAIGWFTLHNAYTEGLALLPFGRESFVIAIEREPRGLAKVINTRWGWKVYPFSPGESPIPPASGRPDDFSGLVAYKGGVLTLERNASAVCFRPAFWLEAIQCWSYEHVENDPQYSYANKDFGIAEGIAVHRRHLYIVLDNNNDTRDIDPQDTRPQVFKFKLPKLYGHF